MDKPSFRQYLQGTRNQLMEALDLPGRTHIRYTLRKYTTLKIAEDSIDFKPKNTLIVEWVYSNNNLTPRLVRVEGLSYDVSSPDKLKRWLSTNCSPGENVNQLTTG